MRRILLIVVIFLASAGISYSAETRGLTVIAKDTSTNQSGEVKLYNKSYAVIIGIDRYKNLSPDRQLKNAVRDAQGIETTLRKQFIAAKVTWNVNSGLIPKTLMLLRRSAIT